MYFECNDKSQEWTFKEVKSQWLVAREARLGQILTNLSKAASFTHLARIYVAPARSHYH